MPDDRLLGAVRRTSVTLLVLGVALIAGWVLLAAVTTIGDRGDIGGGLLLLPGYFCTGGGVFLIVGDLWIYWSKRR